MSFIAESPEPFSVCLRQELGFVDAVAVSWSASTMMKSLVECLHPEYPVLSHHLALDLESLMEPVSKLFANYHWPHSSSLT